jgi:hypothetical protein
MKPIVINVPVNLRDLPGPNFRGNWGKHHRLKAAARLTASWAWAGAGKPRIDGPVVVDVLMAYPPPRLDDDNEVGGLKVLRDAVFNNAVTKDDSQRLVRYGKIQWLECHRPFVKFTVRADEGCHVQGSNI